MQTIIRLKRIAGVMIAIICTGFILYRCMDRENKKLTSEQVPNEKMRVAYDEYAGSATCNSCHSDIYEKHLQTAHHRTSMLPDEKNILGSFQSGRNKYVYTPALYITMNRTDTGLYQSVFYQGERKRDFKFDIVTGSGTKGQTFLYWEGNKLFQMPISYFTAPAQWAVSPGFPADKVLFDKPITTRCLECHTTFAERTSAPDIKHEEYSRNKFILGIECEKCHGPSAGHVAFHSGKDTSKKDVINPASFTRQQQLDMCVLCHGGNMKKTQPSFSYIAGETLADYFTMDTVSVDAVNTGNVDVHGNQFGLLRASACFRQSKTMTCLTCHSPHERERDNTVLFSTRCMNCHQKGHGNFCTIKPMPAGIEKNCIDCHMPKMPSMAVTLYTEGAAVPTPAMIRSHFISIYHDETKKFLPLLK